MNDESGKKHDLHRLDQWVGRHEEDRIPEYVLMIFRDGQNEKIYAQMHQQERHQEEAGKGHYELFGD
jgi:hypothetical protein